MKIISFNSPAGGVGQTTIVKELAAYYAVENNMKVLVCDFKQQFGDMALFMGLPTDKNAVQWIKDIEDRLKANDGNPTGIVYSQKDMEKYITKHEGTGIDVLAATSNLEETLTINQIGETAQVMLQSIKSLPYDIVLVDAGMFNTDDYNYVILSNSDAVVLPYTVDISSINNMQSIMSVLKSTNIGTNNKLITLINKTPGEMLTYTDEGAELLRIASAVGYPVMSYIPDYGEAVRMTKAGIFFTLDNGSKANGIVRELGQKILAGIKS